MTYLLLQQKAFYLDFSSAYTLTLVALIALMFIGMGVQSSLKSTFKKYSRIPAGSGRTASDIADEVLRNNGCNTYVNTTGGTLTDNFNPKKNTVFLSESVHSSTSVAALAVALHEVGHVMQYKEGYAPIKIRNAILPTARIGSYAAPYIVLAGLLMNSYTVAMIGVVLYSAILAFQLITLPVEFNASARALVMLETGGYMQRDELPGAKKVLRMAAMTYVVSTLATLVSLLRILLIVSGSRRRS